MSYGNGETRMFTEEIMQAKRSLQKEVKRQLIEIYAMKNQIEPSARGLLCTDIRTHLEQPTWVIQNWLTMYGGSYFTASAKRVTQLAIRGVPSIRNYFNKA